MNRKAFNKMIFEWAEQEPQGYAARLLVDNTPVCDIYAELVATHPFQPILEDIIRTHGILIDCFESGHKLLLCGNGGSFADALHISSELVKCFMHDRQLDEEEREDFENHPFGEELGAGLEHGLPALVLGNNAALASAVLNDSGEARLVFAQECFVYGQRGDVLMGISTSGNSQNVLMAMSVAQTKGILTIALTGKGGGEMKQVADICLLAPGQSTPVVQERHIALYHAICAGVEAHFFPRLRENT
ncbi:MAG: SIS domain-containing protein [Planctomycetes bacterium]|nr:SIS domain-containing protein [Planctomycetota bacterium]